MIRELAENVAANCEHRTPNDWLWRKRHVKTIDGALDDLAAVEPEKAAIVQLPYFAGLTWEKIAACREVSVATAKRHWLVARAWLYRRLLYRRLSDGKDDAK